MKIKHPYLIIFLTLFCLEILIGFYIQQGFIRAIFGDFIVVLMLYYLLKSISSLKAIYLATIVLAFAYLIEFFQYLDVLQRLNIQKNVITNLILGTTFSFTDLIAYSLGVLTAFVFDKKLDLIFNSSN